MSFYQDNETLDRDRLRAHQSARLCQLLDEIAANPFYRAVFAAHNIEPGDIRAVDALPQLPFTTKAQLVASQARVPPYGDLLTYPLARYQYVHQTSGTSGQPLVWLDTAHSWDTWKRCWGHVYRGAGVTAEDVVFCAMSFGPYIAHWTALDGARHIGALAIPGSAMSSRQRLETIARRAATVVVCTPTYALHLIEVARSHDIDLPTSPVTTVICAGEPGASVPNVKQRIERGWGARCFDHAGATEVGAWAFDCQTPNNAIHLNELEFIFEVVDPSTGAPVDNGARGELVITNLGRPGMPVIRYRTGDLVIRTDEPCECGRTLSRIHNGVLGRADDMLIVRGVNVYPSAIDNLIRKIVEIIEYEVEIRRVGALDELRVKLEVEPADRYHAVKQTLLDRFRDQLNLRVEIEPAASGSLPRYQLKARRFKRIDDNQR